jgi:Holliday junction resolvase RusA-like endonuclease
MIFELVIPGKPVAKGRPRFTRQGHVYTPKKTRSYEKLIADLARLKMRGRKMLEGALRAEVFIYVQLPNHWSKKVKSQKLYQPVITKPDCDNYLKVLDALNGIVFADDAQIAEAKVRKTYSENGFLFLKIEELT